MRTAIYKLKGQRGSLSIEASISLLIFVIAASSLLFIMRDLGYKERVHQQLYEVIHQIQLVDLQNNTECFGLATALMAVESKDEGYYLRVSKTNFEKDGSFSVALSWRSRLPIGNTYEQKYSLSSRLIMRGHDGVSASKNQLVYITDTGKKYHLKNCIHLSRSSTPIQRSEAIKNDYQPCWNCVGGLEPFKKAPTTLGN